VITGICRTKGALSKLNDKVPRSLVDGNSVQHRLKGEMNEHRKAEVDPPGHLSDPGRTDATGPRLGNIISIIAGICALIAGILFLINR